MLHKKLIELVLLIVLLIFSKLTLADPPNRVMRLSYISGHVSLSPFGSTQWVEGKLNRPITSEDQLWTGDSGLLELQLGTEVVRQDHDTLIKILNLDNETLQIALNEGTLNLHIFEFLKNKHTEIDTPNLAFVPQTEGDYKIIVDTKNKTTTVIIHSGQAAVYGQSEAYQLNANTAYRFTGTNLQYKQIAIPALTAFDEWCKERNERYLHSNSQQYVSNEMVGHEDLNQYGRWESNEKYGHIWYPNMPRDWSPYRDGEWIWISPWGWTWVGFEPWGFAPYHYGRWIFIDGFWAWVPGPPWYPPVWGPGIVIFFNWSNSGIIPAENLNPPVQNLIYPINIGWFPLGPSDVYYPPYKMSTGYFNLINTTNTKLDIDVLRKAKKALTLNHFENLHAPNAITIIPAKSMVETKPVMNEIIPLNRKDIEKLSHQTFNPNLLIKPNKTSINGSSNITTIKPKTTILNQTIVVKTIPQAKTLTTQFTVKPIKTHKIIKSMVKPAAIKVMSPNKNVLPNIKPIQPTKTPQSIKTPPDNIQIPSFPHTEPTKPIPSVTSITPATPSIPIAPQEPSRPIHQPTENVNLPVFPINQPAQSIEGSPIHTEPTNQPIMNRQAPLIQREVPMRPEHKNVQPFPAPIENQPQPMVSPPAFQRIEDSAPIAPPPPVEKPIERPMPTINQFEPTVQKPFIPQKKPSDEMKEF